MPLSLGVVTRDETKPTILPAKRPPMTKEKLGICAVRSKKGVEETVSMSETALTDRPSPAPKT